MDSPETIGFYHRIAHALYMDNWVPLDLARLEKVDSIGALNNLYLTIHSCDPAPVATLYRGGRLLGRSSAAEVKALLQQRMQTLFGEIGEAEPVADLS